MKSYVLQRIVTYVSLWLRNFQKDCVILNVGCGPGWLEKSVWRNLRNSTFVAMDISLKMARLTKNQVPWLDVIVADAEALPFRSNTIDAIFSGRAIKWFSASRFLDQANQVLTDGGSIGLVFDSGDALWVRFLERLGLTVDPGNHRRNTRTSELASKFGKLDLKVLSITPIAIFPPFVFLHLPSSLYGVLSFLDRPLKGGRFTFLTGKKIRKSMPIIEENLEFVVSTEKGITAIA